MLTLTDAAVGVLKTVCRGRGVRIGAGGGGCSGAVFRMDLEDGPAAGDEVLDVQGLKVFVDPASWLRLHGVTIDFVDGTDGGGFRFDDPNAPSGCSCAAGRCG